MGFLDRLGKNRRLVLKKWFLVSISSYHPDTSKFLASQKDPFANPVGKVILDGLGDLLEGLIEKKSIKDLRPCLDSLMRVRAVQGFSPSEAVGFFFPLKDVVRRCLYAGLACDDFGGLHSFDRRVDALALMAFDVYMACKEHIYKIKANESRNQFFSSLSRAGLIKES